MTKNFLLFIIVIYTKSLLAANGFYLGTNVGFLGQTNLSDISIKYLSNNTAVSGVDTVDTAFDNEIAFKVMLGYQKHLSEEVGFIANLGYFNQSTVKSFGKRILFSAMDASLAIQIYTGEFLRVKLGVNYPLVTSYQLKMDDATKASLQGGNLKAKGKIGGEIQLAYPFREYGNFYIGYRLTNAEIDEDRHDSSGSAYKVRLDHMASHFVVGIDYIVGRHRRTDW